MSNTDNQLNTSTTILSPTQDESRIHRVATLYNASFDDPSETTNTTTNNNKNNEDGPDNPGNDEGVTDHRTLDSEANQENQLNKTIEPTTQQCNEPVEFNESLEQVNSDGCKIRVSCNNEESDDLNNPCGLSKSDRRCVKFREGDDITFTNASDAGLQHGNSQSRLATVPERGNSSNNLRRPDSVRRLQTTGGRIDISTGTTCNRQVSIKRICASTCAGQNRGRLSSLGSLSWQKIRDSITTPSSTGSALLSPSTSYDNDNTATTTDRTNMPTIPVPTENREDSGITIPKPATARRARSTGDHMDVATGSRTCRQVSIQRTDGNETQAGCTQNHRRFNSLGNAALPWNKVRDLIDITQSTGSGESLSPNESEGLDTGKAVESSGENHQQSEYNSNQPQIPAKQQNLDIIDEDEVVRVRSTIPRPRPQYRIRSTHADNENTRFGKYHPLLAWIAVAFDMHQSFISNSLSDYLRWAFTVSFTRLVVSIALHFLILAVAFAIIIYTIAQRQPYCIYSGGSDFVEAGSDYVDAFQLSWSTLSTVGYGAVGPETASSGHRCVGINMLMAIESFVGVLFGSVTGAIIFGKIVRIQSIAHVRFSYPICVRYGTGVLPKVCFKGINHNSLDGTEKYDENSNPDVDEVIDDDDVQYPCPILEFRIINEMSRERGGEIMNATVHVVASTLASNEEDDLSSRNVGSTPKSLHLDRSSRAKLLHNGAERATKLVGNVRSQAVNISGAALRGVASTATSTAKAATTTAKAGGALLGVGVRAGTTVTGTIFQKWNQAVMGATRSQDDIMNGIVISPDPYLLKQNEDEDGETRSSTSLEKELEQKIAVIEQEKKLAEDKLNDELGKRKLAESAVVSVTVDEGNSKLAPPTIFHKLQIETDSHPFFKRVWNIRHVLDSSSPLLSKKARRMIDKNGGYWPEECNRPEFVRDNVKFGQIIVSFSGTADASRNAVYAQQVYEYDQIAVGYTFASVLFMENDSRLVVDEESLNDVKEQQGGGAEPWDIVVGSRHRRISLPGDETSADS